MAQHETIHDLADRAVSDPENISIADRVRLGAWVVDREEHIAAHKQAVADASAPATAGEPSPLVRRMPPPLAPRPTPMVEHAQLGTGDLKADADERPAA